MDLYKTTTFVEDIVVRAADIPPVETYADVVAESIKSSVRLFLYDAFRLHQPKARVDLNIKGDGTKLVFASGDYQIGQLKLVPFSKSVTVNVEGKGKHNPSNVAIKVPGPKGVTYVAAVQSMGIGKIERNSKQPLGDALVPGCVIVVVVLLRLPYSAFVLLAAASAPPLPSLSSPCSSP